MEVTHGNFKVSMYSLLQNYRNLEMKLALIQFLFHTLLLIMKNQSKYYDDFYKA